MNREKVNYTRIGRQAYVALCFHRGDIQIDSE
jgi:hypothetical protein